MEAELLSGRSSKKTDRIVDFDNFKQNPGGFSLEDATLTVNGITRHFSLFILAADKETKEINMRLEIKTPKDNHGNVETSSTEFWVGYFDFPMIDNTRLPQDQRAAVVLNAFEDGAADITLSYFPGSYASLKDGPYYQDILQKLQPEEANSSKK